MATIWCSGAGNDGLSGGEQLRFASGFTVRLDGVTSDEFAGLGLL